MKKRKTPPQTPPHPEPSPAGGAPAVTTPLYHRPSLQLLLVLLVGLLAYGNTFSVPFVLDDADSIVDNPVVHGLGRFLSGEGYAYNPRRFIGYLSFALNYHVGGLNVFGYHLVNLAVHIASAFLVYALAGLALQASGTRDQGPGTGTSAITDPQSPIPDPGLSLSLVPLFAALLFVAHPVQTQAVTYVVQRLASLATFFYLASVVCYAKGRTLSSREQGSENRDQERALPVPGPRSPVPWYVLALVSGLLALKTKEITVTLPLALILFEFTFFGFSRKKLLILLIPLALGGIVAVVSIAGSGRPLGELLTDVTKMSRQTTAIGRLDYLVTQFSVIATYLRLLVLPLGQNLDYDYPVYTSLFNLRPLWGLLLIGSLMGVALWAWGKGGARDQGSGISSSQDSLQSPEPLGPRGSRAQSLRLISFGLLWFFLTLSVESSFIPIADVIFEHRLYLPSVGFFLALSALVAILARAMGARRVTAIAALLVLALAVATSVRNRAWQSEVSIWQDTVVKSPQKFRPRLNLAIALLNGGDPAGAIEESRKALALDPKDAAAHVNLGAALVMTGKLQEAVEPLNRAVELDPEYVTAYTNLGAAHEKLGDAGRAEALYREALRRRPDLVVGKFNLASLLQRTGRLDEAEGLYRQILQVMPRHVGTLNNLGALLTSRGDHAGAAAALAMAQAADPGSIDSRTLMGDLALARGDSATALSEYAAAIVLRPDLPQLRLSYANLLDRSRRFDKALAAYGEALRLDPTLAEAHNNRGVIYGSRGMLAEAAQEFRRAAQLSPDTAEYRENLARALQLSEERGAENRK